jgi:hypothetical protein
MLGNTDQALLQAGTQGLLNLDGYLVDKHFHDFMVRLRNYDENLTVAALDGQMAELYDAPFVILELCADGNLRAVFECWELNDSVFERLSLADTKRVDVLGHIDKITAQMEAAEDRRYRDKMEENKALVEAVVRNQKSRYTFKDNETGEKVTIYEDRPSKREGL